MLAGRTDTVTMRNMAPGDTARWCGAERHWDLARAPPNPSHLTSRRRPRLAGRAPPRPVSATQTRPRVSLLCEPPPQGCVAR